MSTAEDTLTNEESEIYSRQLILEDIGYEGQVKLKNAHVAVLGTGGLGVPIILQLSGMGIGRIRLVDRDVVSRSDLHRQYLYDVDSIGYPKAEVAAKKLQRLNPNISIEPVADAVTTVNIEEIIEGVDVVIDALDSIETRYIVNRACVKLNIPYIFGAAIEAYGNTTTIIPNKTACLECFYTGLQNKDLPRCAIVGVNPPILGSIGSIQVSEAVRVIQGLKPNLINKLLYVDLRNLSFDEIPISRRQECPVCGVNPQPSSIEERKVEAVCGRDGRGVFSITPEIRTKVELEKLREFVASKGLKVKTNSRLSVAFDYDQQITLTIFESGAAIVQMKPPSSPEDTKRILDIYRLILVNEIGVPQKAIPHQ